jgi:hypothetical protein
MKSFIRFINQLDKEMNVDETFESLLAKQESLQLRVNELTKVKN